MSRFVSGGTYTEDDSNNHDQRDESKDASAAASQTSSAREDAWLAAQKRINAAKQSTGSLGGLGSGTQEGGKSLFEVLQANKAAKQEAHEEALKLSNQFRSLDEDEVAFLDSVAASSRAQEEAEKRETREQLDAFRRLQAESASASGSGGGTADFAAGGKAGPGELTMKGTDEISRGDPKTGEGSEWRVDGSGNARKRKKGGGGGVIAGVKIRRTSSSAVDDDVASGRQKAGEAPEDTDTSSTRQNDAQRSTSTSKQQPSTDTTRQKSETASTAEIGTREEAPVKSSPSPPAAALGLAAYSSSDEDE